MRRCCDSRKVLDCQLGPTPLAGKMLSYEILDGLEKLGQAVCELSKVFCSFITLSRIRSKQMRLTTPLVARTEYCKISRLLCSSHYQKSEQIRLSLKLHIHNQRY